MYCWCHVWYYAAFFFKPLKCTNRINWFQLMSNYVLRFQRILAKTCWNGWAFWETMAHLRPISLQRLSLLRLLDSNFQENPLWTWEFHPLKLRFCLSQTLWTPDSQQGDWLYNGTPAAAWKEMNKHKQHKQLQPNNNDKHKQQHKQ